MLNFYSRWISHRADSELRRENERLAADVARLREELAAAKSTIRIQSHELDELAAVIARNLRRVEAETAAAARGIATIERE